MKKAILNKKWLVIRGSWLVIFCLSAVISAKIINPVIVPIDPTGIAITSKVTYIYDAKLPDGSTKQITSPTVLTDKQVQSQVAFQYDAEQVKLKEIDEKVAALTYKGTVVSYKTWILYGKIISYDYYYRLPDGTYNQICSKVPLKEEEVLAQVKAVYKSNLTEEVRGAL